MDKNLVVYFSVYGTAKKIAEEIAKQTLADLVEIEPAISYDNNRDHYDALARLAKKECDHNIRPAIKNKINVQDYDRIFIGYPIWWYTFPMIVYTFFDQYDFGGKTIIPFNTHMGSGDGGTYQTIRELASDAKVLPGLPIEMSEAEQNISATVKQWLERIGFPAGDTKEK